MSHRQKNKHKSRHRIHANNGPRIPQNGRVLPGPAKSPISGVAATETMPAETTASSASTAAL